MIKGYLCWIQRDEPTTNQILIEEYWLQGHKEKRRLYRCQNSPQHMELSLTTGDIKKKLIRVDSGPKYKKKPCLLELGGTIVLSTITCKMEPYRYGLRYGPLPRVAIMQRWRPILDKRVSSAHLSILPPLPNCAQTPRERLAPV
jgi:hypothetical protein